jgi:hypothetical protein
MRITKARLRAIDIPETDMFREGTRVLLCGQGDAAPLFCRCFMPHEVLGRNGATASLPTAGELFVQREREVLPRARRMGMGTPL